jgi:hypothetical protein
MKHRYCRRRHSLTPPRQNIIPPRSRTSPVGSIYDDSGSRSVIGKRVGPYLVLRDAEGLRHLARINSVALASETDPMGDDLILIIAGRPVRVLATLDEVMEWLGIPAD